MLQKLIRQYGEYGNEYSPVEMGDKINEIIDLLISLSNGGDNPLIVTQTSVVEEAEVVANIIEKNTDGIAVRSPSTSDKVYLIKGDTKHWIKNPETLAGLGFKFSDVKDIKNEEMASYKIGEPINLKESEPLQVVKPKDGFDIYDI